MPALLARTHAQPPASPTRPAQRAALASRGRRRSRASPTRTGSTQPVDAFGLHYDTVENHGWYRNLDLTVEQLAGDLRDGDVLIDYSGGTGILLDRLRLRIFDRQVGMVIVDSSPKFLRVALDRFRDDPRVAFRRLHYLKDERRLQYVDEVLGGAFAGRPRSSRRTRSTSTTTSTATLARLDARAASPAARVRINSGNIRNPRAGADEWIIDETVYVVHEVATGLVRTEQRWTRLPRRARRAASACSAYLE